MTRTQRTIGISAFVMLAVLGTGWALEKGYSTQRGVAADEPAMEIDPINAPDSSQPMDEQPAAPLETATQPQTAEPEFPWLADLRSEDAPSPPRARRRPVAPTPEIATPVQQPAPVTSQSAANDPSAVFPPRKPRRARFGADRSGGKTGSAS